MIGILIIIVIAVLLLGVVFKLAKLAIIVALIIAGVMFVQKKLGGGGDGPRLK
ncbi:MAG: hypothetical protein ABIO29_03060 [Sphingomicrobium sp.]